MNRFLVITAVPAFLLVFSCSFFKPGANTTKEPGQIVWNIDNLTSIGGNTPTVLGSPRCIDTPRGKALLFDGVRDALVMDSHPLEGATAFTIEIVFRPDRDGAPEQRFLHLQEDGGDNRLLIETRLIENSRWSLDTYMKSGETDQTLLEMGNTHPLGEWYNAAFVFDGREMRHYINGVMELSAGIASFTPPKAGKTSIGVRINRVYWFKGAVRTVRFTRRALSPKEFLKP
ncbi:LamG domain-containing protein [bacterium]|nr:LamG domain-containing protein [bacterium]